MICYYNLRRNPCFFHGLFTKHNYLIEKILNGLHIINIFIFSFFIFKCFCIKKFSIIFDCNGKIYLTRLVQKKYWWN